MVAKPLAAAPILTVTGLTAAERYREAVQRLTVHDHTGDPIPVTASFGLAVLESGESIESVIDRADRAMYAGKTAGRNCVRVSPSTHRTYGGCPWRSWAPPATPWLKTASGSVSAFTGSGFSMSTQVTGKGSNGVWPVLVSKLGRPSIASICRRPPAARFFR